MGMYEDVKNAVDLWRASSTLTKNALGFSAFLAFSSIASLSDVVFQWKGFINDGLNIYATTVPAFFSKLAESIGGTLEQGWSNYFVLAVILVTSAIRLSLNYKRKDHQQIMLVWCVLLVLWLTGTFVFRIFIFPIYYHSSLFILVLAYFAPPFLIPLDREDKFVYFLPLALAVFGVLLLGAINSGLTQ